MHTSQAFRGKGAGKALIHHAVKLFKTQHINEMRLWVVVGNNNAIAIYEHLGAAIHIERTEIINGVDVPEIGMTWIDLDLMENK